MENKIWIWAFLFAMIISAWAILFMASAQVQVGGGTKAGVILEEPEEDVVGGNASFNATVLTNYWDLAGANSPPTNNWNMGGNNFTGLGRLQFITPIILGNAVTNAHKNNGIAIGNNAQASGQFSIAHGYIADARGDTSFALGHLAIAIDNGDYAIGEVAQASGGNSIAFGNGAKTSGLYSIAIGDASATIEREAITIGFQSTANQESVAIGSNADNFGNNSFLIGRDITSYANDTFTVGYNYSVFDGNVTADYFIGNGSSLTDVCKSDGTDCMSVGGFDENGNYTLEGEWEFHNNVTINVTEGSSFYPYTFNIMSTTLPTYMFIGNASDTAGGMFFGHEKGDIFALYNYANGGSGGDITFNNPVTALTINKSRDIILGDNTPMIVLGATSYLKISQPVAPASRGMTISTKDFMNLSTLDDGDFFSFDDGMAKFFFNLYGININATEDICIEGGQCLSNTTGISVGDRQKSWSIGRKNDSIVVGTWTDDPTLFRQLDAGKNYSFEFDIIADVTNDGIEFNITWTGTGNLDYGWHYQYGNIDDAGLCDGGCGSFGNVVTTNDGIMKATGMVYNITSSGTLGIAYIENAHVLADSLVKGGSNLEVNELEEQ